MNKESKAEGVGPLNKKQHLDKQSSNIYIDITFRFYPHGVFFLSRGEDYQCYFRTRVKNYF